MPIAGRIGSAITASKSSTNCDWTSARSTVRRNTTNTCAAFLDSSHDRKPRISRETRGGRPSRPLSERRHCCSPRGTTWVVARAAQLELGEVMLVRFVMATRWPMISSANCCGRRQAKTSPRPLGIEIFGQRLLDDAVRHAELESAPVAFVDIEVVARWRIRPCCIASRTPPAILVRYWPKSESPIRRSCGLYEVNGVVEEDEHGCGSCGSGGCGSCGTGGCSSCSSGAARTSRRTSPSCASKWNQRNRVALL